MNVPSDVWFHIAKFLPESTLVNLYGLNSALLQIAFELRYRSVTFGRLGRKHLQWMLRLRDPYVAKFVRSVSLKSTIELEKDKEAEPAWKQRIKDFKRSILHKPSSNTLAAPSLTLEAEMTQSLLETLTALTNVTSLFVGWWEQDFPAYLSPVLDAAFSFFGARVKILTVGGNLEVFEQLLHQPLAFSVLEDLRLEFVQNVLRQNRESDREILQNKVLPLVNSLKGQLRSLWIISFAPLDLVAFFALLGNFPNLERLQVRIPFNKAFSTDEDVPGLKRLVQSHSLTLKNISIRLNPSGYMVDAQSETSLSNWLISLLETDPHCVQNLRILQIYPTMLPIGAEIMYSFIQRSASTLTRLIVRDRYLTFEEVKGLVQIFHGEMPGGQLKELVLNVRILNVKVFDVLAFGLPNLLEIELRVGEGPESADASESNINTEQFRIEIQKRTYSKWMLREIGIWQGGSELDIDTMTLVGNSIPSVKSFWGRGDLRHPLSAPTLTWPGSRFNN